MFRCVLAYLAMVVAWSCLGVCGHAWACLDMAGRVSVCLVVYGRVWSCLAILARVGLSSLSVCCFWGYAAGVGPRGTRVVLCLVMLGFI